MKKLLLLLIITLIMTQFLVLSTGANNTSDNADRKIVVFKKDFTDKDLKEKLLNKYGAQKLKHLDLINAVAVKMTPHVQALLEKDSDVARIDDDIEVQALGQTYDQTLGNVLGKPALKPTPVPTPVPQQVLPWGIDRIDADHVTIDDNTSIKHVNVAVIDTGIDYNHPDLSGIVKGGINTIGPSNTPYYLDDNGHGTHVAGIIAALNNNFGVVGVSSGIDLYSIKVLNKKGSGFVSDIIDGLNWAVDNKIQIVNMSLGASASVDAFRDAVLAAYKKGIVIVAAAGNESGPVCYPAAYEGVIAVAATDSNDKVAYFSNFGSEVDIAAPGVYINSTYKGSTYATLSGTSMASPHVAGVAALVLMANPSYTAAANNDQLIPDKVAAQIKATASASVSPPSNAADTIAAHYYGAGLVDAYKAVYNKDFIQ